jgi:hypothetical protein
MTVSINEKAVKTFKVANAIGDVAMGYVSGGYAHVFMCAYGVFDPYSAEYICIEHMLDALYLGLISATEFFNGLKVIEE